MMDDLISRQAAIEAVDIGNLHRGIVDALQNIILELPSAQRKGKWYAIGNTGLATCECGYITDRHSVYNYCPKCGALMKGAEE